MQSFAKLVFLLFLGFCFNISGCEEQHSVSYPVALNHSEEILDATLDMAETFLLNGEYQSARDFYEEVIAFIGNHEGQEIRILRSLLGSFLANACLGNDEALDEIAYLTKAFESFHCQEAQSFSTTILANGQPILGEDKISITDCLQRVDNTFNFAKDILAIAPVNWKWKAGVIASLDLAFIKANQCCRSGGLWKACLQPLLTKWLQLKEWEKECRKIGDWYYLPPLD